MTRAAGGRHIRTERRALGITGTTHFMSGVAIGADRDPFVSFGQTIHLWDVDTHKRLFDFQGHEKAINAVAVTSDGKAWAS